MTKQEIIIKGGMRNQFKDGTSKLANRPCYGYIKQNDRVLAVHETEAEIVRWIFERYVAGDSLDKIAKGLAKKGIPSPTGREKWNRQAIDKLLSNEKYTGCALLQKTFTVNGQQIHNNGKGNRYLYRNNNPAIICKAIFIAVQEEKAARARNQEKVVTRNEFTQYM